MLQYFIDHPVWIAVFVAVILLTVFVCFKAAQASSRRYAANEKTMKKIKEENTLRNEFSILTENLISAAEPDRLFKGVALNLQKKISDADDMTAEFNALSDGQQYIYALSFYIKDGERTPIDGKLIYRGIDLKDIVSGCRSENRFGYEEVSYLLLFGNLPTKEQLEN